MLSCFLLAVSACCMLSCSPLAASASAQPAGVKLVGRWLSPDDAPTATYAGSTAVFRFEHSGSLSLDLKIVNSKGDQDLFIAVSVDGGKPVRIGLSRGEHAGFRVVSGLSVGPHIVTVRKEGEPWFGALQFSNPKLDVAGRWQTIVDDRPIIEVIGDSDATGICVLGPGSPADAVSIWNSDWASESLSWVGLLEAGLAAAGHPADVVDLAISSSKTESEADSYDYTAPGYSKAAFGDYAPPGHRHASLVFLWGGGNDRHAGGDLASGSPITYDHLSAFEKGVYDQLTKIFARNPDVSVVLLEYIDPAIPNWKPAFDEVESLLPNPEQSRIFHLRVYDPKGTQDSCKVDPLGHPNLYLHSAWAAQILAWMLSNDMLQQLGFPSGQQWSEP